ncbi:MAG: DUF2818 family protein [Guyparkeria sp.]
MDSIAATVVLVAFGLFAANLPWFSDRWLLILPPRRAKPVWLRLGETVVLYGAFVVVGVALERAVTGGIHDKGWIFFTITACLFAVFAAPGIIWRKDLRPLLRS